MLSSATLHPIDAPPAPLPGPLPAPRGEGMLSSATLRVSDAAWPAHFAALPGRSGPLPPRERGEG